MLFDLLFAGDSALSGKKFNAAGVACQWQKVIDSYFGSGALVDLPEDFSGV